MKVYKKHLFFTLLTILLQLFLVKNVSAERTPQTKTLKSPAEICLAFDLECDTAGENTDGSFVQGNNITINSPQTTDIIDFYNIEFDSLNISFKSSINLRAPILFLGKNLTINDSSTSDAPTILSDENIGLFNLNVAETLINNLKISAQNSTLISLGLDSSLTINGGTYKGESIIELFDDSSVTINDGSFEANSFSLIDLHKAKEVSINNGSFKSGSVFASVYNFSDNLKIRSGTFEVSSENEEAQIFKIFGSNDKEETEKLILGYIDEDSMIYDLENETKEVTFDSKVNSRQEKGLDEYGFVKTKKIAIVAKEGKGEVEEVITETQFEEETHQESPKQEVSNNTEILEENPDTLVDHPVLYFSGVILTTLGLFISAKKYLES